MPERSKVRWSQLKVGVVAGVGFIILFTAVFVLTSNIGILQRYELLRTFMDDASGIAESTPVRLNGITVGYLDKLALTSSPDPHRTIEFDMKVKSKYLREIPVDSVAGISAANLLGDKFINITKGRAARAVQPGAELKSQTAQDIPELMAQSANLFQSLQGIVNRLDALLVGIEAGKGNLGKFVKDEELYDRLNSLASEGQKLVADVRTGGGTISKLIYDTSLYDEIRAPINRLNALLTGLQGGEGTAGKLLKDPALYDEARQTIAEMRGLLADLNAGKGTAGKLMKDDGLYQRIDELIAKLTGTVDKISSGQGTLGQLVVNPALYDSLNDATHELQGLTKDIRANPKKFLTLRLALF
ncbi:MAG: MlaD family protein [Bryobacteraceae bacterium]|jgi:phospholipid/cholesterol/gamma-HCH transport system substrate-binding protein